MLVWPEKFTNVHGWAGFCIRGDLFRQWWRICRSFTNTRWFETVAVVFELYCISLIDRQVDESCSTVKHHSIFPHENSSGSVLYSNALLPFERISWCPNRIVGNHRIVFVMIGIFLVVRCYDHKQSSRLPVNGSLKTLKLLLTFIRSIISLNFVVHYDLVSIKFLQEFTTVGVFAFTLHSRSHYLILYWLSNSMKAVSIIKINYLYFRRIIIFIFCVYNEPALKEWDILSTAGSILRNIGNCKLDKSTRLVRKILSLLLQILCFFSSSDYVCCVCLWWLMLLDSYHMFNKLFYWSPQCPSNIWFYQLVTEDFAVIFFYYKIHHFFYYLKICITQSTRLFSAMNVLWSDNYSVLLCSVVIANLR